MRGRPNTVVGLALSWCLMAFLRQAPAAAASSESRLLPLPAAGSPRPIVQGWINGDRFELSGCQYLGDRLYCFQERTSGRDIWFNIFLPLKGKEKPASGSTYQVPSAWHEYPKKINIGHPRGGWDVHRAKGHTDIYFEFLLQFFKGNSDLLVGRLAFSAPARNTEFAGYFLLDPEGEPTATIPYSMGIIGPGESEVAIFSPLKGLDHLPANVTPATAKFNFQTVVENHIMKQNPDGLWVVKGDQQGRNGRYRLARTDLRTLREVKPGYFSATAAMIEDNSKAMINIAFTVDFTGTSWEVVSAKILAPELNQRSRSAVPKRAR